MKSYIELTFVPEDNEKCNALAKSLRIVILFSYIQRKAMYCECDIYMLYIIYTFVFTCFFLLRPISIDVIVFREVSRLLLQLII